MDPVRIEMDQNTLNWIIESKTRYTGTTFKEHFGLEVVENHSLNWPLTIFRVYRDKYARLHVVVRNQPFEVENFLSVQGRPDVMIGDVFQINVVRFIRENVGYVIYYNWSIRREPRRSIRA